MMDPGVNVGFSLNTAGSKYEWVGGDNSRVIVGDNRSIVGGMYVNHITGNRLTQIGGANESHLFSGSKTVIHGASTYIVLKGPQTRFVNGNQANAIVGSRYVFNKSIRTEINIAFRTDLWSLGRLEVGLGGKKELISPFKFETIGGIKHTSVLGAKIDHCKGRLVTVSNGPVSHKYPNVGYAILGSVVWNVSRKLTFKGEKVEKKAPKVEVDAKVENDKDVANKANDKTTGKNSSDGKLNAGAGNLG
jgi:hypothetical protein